LIVLLHAVRCDAAEPPSTCKPLAASTLDHHHSATAAAAAAATNDAGRYCCAASRDCAVLLLLLDVKPGLLIVKMFSLLMLLHPVQHTACHHSCYAYSSRRQVCSCVRKRKRSQQATIDQVINPGSGRCTADA
jgi:hypothetical protein